jgi:cobalamin-dependent methionine synthase I
LKNNGYDVVNLGIKVPPEELIKAYLQHHPDAIGLSGLLVKSAQQMVITANDLKDAGIAIPRWWRRRAVAEIHADKNRAELRECGVLREGRDDRIAVDE